MQDDAYVKTNFQIFSAALLLLAGACNANPKISLDALAVASEVVGGDFCNDARRFVNRDLNQSNVFVGTHPLYCGEWVGVYSGTDVISGQLSLAGWDVPIVFYSKRKIDVNEASNTVYVRIIGGPGLSIAPSDFERVYLNAMREGDVLISLGYSGTSHGSLFPAPNENLAIEQISELLSSLREKNPRSRIVVLAESLGAPLALSAVDRIDFVNFKLILISPMTLSPKLQVDRFLEINDKEFPLNGVARIKSINKKSGKNEYGLWANVRSGDALLSFFENESRGINLAYRLKASRIGRSSVFVLYGERDEATPSKDMNAMIELLGRNVRMIHHQNHRFTRVSRDELTEELKRIFDS